MLLNSTIVLIYADFCKDVDLRLPYSCSSDRITREGKGREVLTRVSKMNFTKFYSVNVTGVAAKVQPILSIPMNQDTGSAFTQPVHSK
jgi:hypothetical protein